MMTWLDSITDSKDMNLSKLGETVKDREAWCATVHGKRFWEVEAPLEGGVEAPLVETLVMTLPTAHVFQNEVS